MTTHTSPNPQWDTTQRGTSQQGRLRAATRLRIAAVVGSLALAVGAGPLVAVAATGRDVPSVAPFVGAALAPAAAVGRLTPRGCTSSAPGVVACDLWAMPGNNQVLGTDIPIWGYSTTGVAGSATAPGPVLVVNRGDQVTITVHNALSEPTSLALPGQPAASITSGLSAGGAEVGVAPGDSAAYGFIASRAGTFLYEAGHTAGGARQVAMGLAGALVVLETGADYGTAYGAAYDDEAVLVLSEIDPALNAAPAAFDMRHFRARFRLINGKPYPSSDIISTDQGHKVLLRYVDVGAEAHPMVVLGSDQTVLANDGHPLAYPEPVVVAALEPGLTLDAITTMPTGPESKLALYESSGRLDNNGQTTADPLSVAFGGMLTFLDTAAPPPSSDSVGPVSTLITAAPNPSNALADVTVTARVSDSATGGGKVDRAELVIDDATTLGAGFGTAMTTTSGTFGADTTVGVTGTIPATPIAPATCSSTPPAVALSCLDAGKHLVYVRGHDAAGNWGVIGGTVLNLPKTGPSTTAGSVSPSPASASTDVILRTTGDDGAAGGKITAAEYFTGAVGANGTGTALSLNRQATVVSETATLPAATVAALGEGETHLFVHSYDSLGLWGPPLDVTLAVDLTAPTVRAASVAPNPTNGLISGKSNPGYLVISALIEDVDARGGAQSVLSDAEAFLDPASPTLAGGTGLQLLPVDGALDASSETVYGLLPLSQVRSLSNGIHHVVVRGQDAAGNWGSLTGTNATIELVVDKAAPVLGVPTAAPNPTAGSDTVTLTAAVNEAGLQSAEFWLGTTDPGAGKGTRLPVSVTAGTATATIQLVGLPTGSQRFNLRVLDLAGNWSNATNVTVQIDRSNRIFGDTFDSGTLAAWWQRTGSPTVTDAAGIPAAPGNLGMQVTLPGRTANAPAYVTDNTPTAETGYHAQFAFAANTLTTGNAANPLTVFEGRSGGAQVFAVQFRRTGTGVAQLRTLMARSGAAVLTSGWTSLGAGAHTVRVDWASGPATGATAGTLRLTVDGTLAQTLTGNTSTLRIETARLGLIAGIASGTGTTEAGSAFFDSFTSTRFTLP
ncbi:MAG: multicopper oxidase domain-containing protein [Dermatophilaceae bacterium]